MALGCSGYQIATEPDISKNLDTVMNIMHTAAQQKLAGCYRLFRRRRYSALTYPILQSIKVYGCPCLLVPSGAKINDGA